MAPRHQPMPKSLPGEIVGIIIEYLRDTRVPPDSALRSHFDVSEVLTCLTVDRLWFKEAVRVLYGWCATWLRPIWKRVWALDLVLGIWRKSDASRWALYASHIPELCVPLTHDDNITPEFVKGFTSLKRLMLTHEGGNTRGTTTIDRDLAAFLGPRLEHVVFLAPRGDIDQQLAQIAASCPNIKVDIKTGGDYLPYVKASTLTIFQQLGDFGFHCTPTSPSAYSTKPHILTLIIQCQAKRLTAHFPSYVVPMDDASHAADMTLQEKHCHCLAQHVLELDLCIDVQSNVAGRVFAQQVYPKLSTLKYKPKADLASASTSASSQELFVIVENCPNLKVLELESMAFPSDPNAGFKALAQLRRLQELKFSNIGNMGSLPVPTNHLPLILTRQLRRLDWGIPLAYKDDGAVGLSDLVTFILKRCPAIDVLKLEAVSPSIVLAGRDDHAGLKARLEQGCSMVTEEARHNTQRWYRQPYKLSLCTQTVQIYGDVWAATSFSLLHLDSHGVFRDEINGATRGLQKIPGFTPGKVFGRIEHSVLRDMCRHIEHAPDQRLMDAHGVEHIWTPPREEMAQRERPDPLFR